MDTKAATAIITQQLLALQDEAYREFQLGLIPNVPPETFIGVRTPMLRKLAKKLAGTPEAEAFLTVLPHPTFDENNLHAFLLEAIGSYDEAIRRVNTFLPYVNNWATCDQMSPKVFKRHLAELYDQIPLWLKPPMCIPAASEWAGSCSIIWMRPFSRRCWRWRLGCIRRNTMST